MSKSTLFASVKELTDVILSNGGLITYFHFEEYIDGPPPNYENLPYVAVTMWPYGNYCETEFSSVKGTKGYEDNCGSVYYYGWIPFKYWGEIKHLNFRIGRFLTEGNLVSISDKGVYLDFPIHFRDERDCKVMIKNKEALIRFLNNRGQEVPAAKIVDNRVSQIVSRLGEENIRFHYEYYQNLTAVTTEDIAKDVLLTGKLNAVTTLRYLELKGVKITKTFEDGVITGRMAQLPYGSVYHAERDEEGVFRFHYPMHFRAFGGDYETVFNDNDMVQQIGRFNFYSNILNDIQTSVENNRKVLTVSDEEGVSTLSDDDLPF